MRVAGVDDQDRLQRDAMGKKGWRRGGGGGGGGKGRGGVGVQGGRDGAVESMKLEFFKDDFIGIPGQDGGRIGGFGVEEGGMVRITAKGRLRVEEGALPDGLFGFPADDVAFLDRSTDLQLAKVAAVVEFLANVGELVAL